MLVGFMGAGKTSVGRVLGENLGWTFEDLDQRIERRERRKVHEIFHDSGEPEFRCAEHAALKELLRELSVGSGKIVALGGGAFVQKRNAQLLQAAGVPTVFLDGSAEELWRRCRRQADGEGLQRPLLTSLPRFRELYDSRRPHYSKASFTLRTTGKSVDEITAEVIAALGLRRNSLNQNPRTRGAKQ